MKSNQTTKGTLSIALFAFAVGVGLTASGAAWAKPKADLTGPDPTTITACGTLSADHTVYVIGGSGITTSSSGTCITLSGNNDVLVFEESAATIQGPGANPSLGVGIDIEGSNDVINGRASTVTGFRVGILDNGTTTLVDDIDVGCFTATCTDTDENVIGIEGTGHTTKWTNIGSYLNTGTGIWFNKCDDDCSVADFFTSQNGGDGLLIQGTTGASAAVFIASSNVGNGVHVGGPIDGCGTTSTTLADGALAGFGVSDNGQNGVFLDTSESSANDAVTGIEAESNDGIDLYDATENCGSSKGPVNLWTSLIATTTKAGSTTSPACIPLLPNL